MIRKMIIIVLIGTLMFSVNIFNVIASEKDMGPDTIQHSKKVVAPRIIGGGVD